MNTLVIGPLQLAQSLPCLLSNPLPLPNFVSFLQFSILLAASPPLARNPTNSRRFISFTLAPFFLTPLYPSFFCSHSFLFYFSLLSFLGHLHENITDSSHQASNSPLIKFVVKLPVPDCLLPRRRRRLFHQSFCPFFFSSCSHCTRLRSYILLGCQKKP